MSAPPPPPYSELDPNPGQVRRRPTLPNPPSQAMPNPWEAAARTQSAPHVPPRRTAPVHAPPNAVPPPRADPRVAASRPEHHSSSRSAPQRQVSVRDVPEDQFELLRDYDTIFIIDDSASMQVNEMPDGSIGPSRWDEARDALCGVVRIAARYDDDGIDVHFINDKRSLLRCRDPRMVQQLFHEVRPRGATPTGGRLELLLLDYMDAIEYAAHKNKKYGPGTVKPPKRRNVRRSSHAVCHHYRRGCDR